jgi:hypothetical protein
LQSGKKRSTEESTTQTRGENSRKKPVINQNQNHVEYYGDKTVIIQGSTRYVFKGNPEETPLDAALAALKLLVKLNKTPTCFVNRSGEDVSDRVPGFIHIIEAKP